MATLEYMRKKAINAYAYAVQMMNVMAVIISFVIMIVTMVLNDIAGYCYGIENAYGTSEGLIKLLVIMMINFVIYGVAELIKTKMES